MCRGDHGIFPGIIKTGGSACETEIKKTSKENCGDSGYSYPGYRGSDNYWKNQKWKDEERKTGNTAGEYHFTGEDKSEYADVKSEENSKVAKAKKAYEEAKKSKQKDQLTQAKTEYENAVSTRKLTLKQSKSSIEQAQEALDTAKSSANKSIKEAKKQVTQA